jgi:hypothetical protein
MGIAVPWAVRIERACRDFLGEKRAYFRAKSLALSR